MVPKIVERVQERARALLQGHDIAIVIDGGAAELCQKSKVLVVLASGPGLPFDVVLEVIVLPVHENSKIQAKVISDTAKKHNVPKERIRYLAADGAEVNPATVKLLNEKFGFEIDFARCLPHAIARALLVLLQTFEAEYGITSFLKKFRGFVKGGGGGGKLRQLFEMGMSLSSIDVVDTRWASVIEAVVRLAGFTKLSDLAAARKSMEELIAEGHDEDGSAAAALQAGDEAMSFWKIMYDFLESYELKDLEKADRRARTEPSTGVDFVTSVSTRNILLNWLANLDNYAAVQALAIMFGGGETGLSCSSIFKLTQGDPRFARTLHKGGRFAVGADGKPIIPSIVSSVQQLISGLKGLQSPDELDLLIQDVQKGLDAQRDRLIKAAEDDGEGLVAGSLGFNVGDIAEFKTVYAARCESALKRLRKTVLNAARLMEQSEAFPKLEKVLAALSVGDRFGLREIPPVEPAGVADIWAFFGIKEVDRTIINLNKLRIGWEAHRKGFVSGSDSSPKATHEYWIRLSMNDDTAFLARYALYHLLRPISSAAAERIFSYLTQLDNPRRRRMKKLLLSQTLYLRGNWRIVEMLHAEFAQEQRDANACIAELNLKPRMSEKKILAANAIARARAAAAIP